MSMAAGQRGGDWYAEFTEPNGRLVKNERGEDVFVPSRLRPGMPADVDMVRLLSQAERRVGELKGMCAGHPDPRSFARACLKREAVSSSRIEGAGATLDDLNVHEAVGGAIDPASDGARLQEVVNCARALDEAVSGEGPREVDLASILRAHRTLMLGVGGGEKAPGRLREEQNYIVRYAGRGVEVRYKPPPHVEVAPLLGDMIEFLRSTPDKELSGLVQCALAHYQFEAIHPFLDGNGRVGRLVIPVILRSKGVLPEPLLCLSAYFDENREEYYYRLRRVSQASEWRQWTAFFLTAVIEQAGRTIEAMRGAARLESRYLGALGAMGAGPYAGQLLPSLLANPYTTIPLAAKALGRTYPAAKKAVRELVAAGILRRADVKCRAKVFYAEEIDRVLGGR